MKKTILFLLPFLWIFDGNAQVLRSNASSFEVSASIYPWDVHDEGINLILDNLTSMSGVNSVYLVAVMEELHRPYWTNMDRMHEWQFIHNPARTEYMVDASRVYFHPQMSYYGRIKPKLSDDSWLSDTDWLKVVIDAARARGLKVGAEVSHKYLPEKEIFKSNPEYQQRDINNKPGSYPCPNNPDIREYLLALYGDMATNYDLDYIQTCMILFSGSGVRDGTCFCDACQKEAKAIGFDLAAAIPILRDNHNAQPQLDQWLNFRRASTTKIYKMIVDRMRQGNPKIDFRINDLNNRPSGLYLEDLKTYITSDHVSIHTEGQRGYQRTDRKSRIETARYFLGPDVPLIAAISVRQLATPALVKSSIKISVDNGAKGIALKHYDGASYSLLRAVRDGLSAAGVKGFTPHLGMEVENMTLSGYIPDICLTEHCVMTSGTGTAKSVFTSASGVYDVIVSYVDEKNGQGTLILSVGGKQKTTWKLNEDVACWRRKTIPDVKIKNGDEIKIVGVANGSEAARVDYIEFVKK